MKRYLDYYEERDNAFVLAKQIHETGYIPDVIYACMRGGAIVANVVSEYYKLQTLHKPVFYAAVAARSYTGIGEHGAVMIDGWTYAPEHLRPGDKVMLIDDIYDSGRTIDKLARVILERGVTRKDLKIVVHTYKSGLQSEGLIKPDFWCEENDEWTVFLSHEADGLDKDELSSFNIRNDPRLIGVL